MSTAGDGTGYDAHVFPLTNEYSRIQKPSWSPDGSKLVFGGSLDFAGASGLGTEIYTIDFDTTGLAAGTMVLDNNIDRLTFSDYTDGDPIQGTINTTPVFSRDGGKIIFVSTQRAPANTHRDRNIWYIPSDGSLDPEIFFFTRFDDSSPSVNPDGTFLLSTSMGFSQEELDRIEEEAYQDIFDANEADPESNMSEVMMRTEASEQRRMLEFFEGVMSHIFIFTP